MERQVAGYESDVSDEIDLMQMLQRLWSQWRLICVCVIVALVMAVTYLHFATYTYTATLRVIPAQGSRQGPSLSGSLGGLASLAGISMSGDETTPFSLFLETVQSRSVADALAKRPDIMKVVFEDQWNEQAGKFVSRESALKKGAAFVKGVLGVRNYEWEPPDGAQMKIYLKENLRVVHEHGKIIAELSFDHEDPSFAVTFLKATYEVADALLRQATLRRVNMNIDYLSRTLPNVTQADHRMALVKILSDEEKTKMLASSGAPHAAEIVDTPSASFRPTSPRPALVILLAIFAGLFFGAVVALVRTRWKESRFHC